MCVAEAGPLDLLLTVRSEESARSTDHKGPGLEVEFSGGQVHLMTCVDSIVALRDIIMHLDSDGEFEPSGCAGAAETRQQATPPSVSRLLCAGCWEGVLVLPPLNLSLSFCLCGQFLVI